MQVARRLLVLAVLVLADAAFALTGQLLPWHLAGLLLAATLARQALRLRPIAGDD